MSMNAKAIFGGERGAYASQNFFHVAAYAPKYGHTGLFLSH